MTVWLITAMKWQNNMHVLIYLEIKFVEEERNRQKQRQRERKRAWKEVVKFDLI